MSHKSTSTCQLRSNIHPEPTAILFVRSFPLKTLIGMCLIFFAPAGTATLQAQSCDGIPSGGGQSLSAGVTINGTSIPPTARSVPSVMRWASWPPTLTTTPTPGITGFTGCAPSHTGTARSSKWNMRRRTNSRRSRTHSTTCWSRTHTMRRTAL